MRNRSHFVLTTLLLLLLCPFVAQAQTKYTEYLQRQVAGRGHVVLHQDAEIENLVNGITTGGRQNGGGSATIDGEISVTDPAPAQAPSGRHTTGNGFRVQVVSLGSTAKDKADAEAWGRKFKSYFPGVNVYISFRSPHYTCRVGDFRTREEANELLQQMRETNQFGSSSIVRSNINIYY